MPTIESISLKNFKGVEAVTIELQGKASCPVITLIGLNESGKTTVLEGIASFVSGDNVVSKLFDKPNTTSNLTSLIPVHRKAAFTGDIEISAKIRLDSDDIDAVQRLARKHHLKVSQDDLIETFPIIRRFQFKDSALQKNTNYWHFRLLVRKETGKLFKPYQRPPKDEDPDLWLEIANLLEERLPRIVYFPTFLVDMPTRIYLKEYKDEPAVNRYYRYVFQDILNSLNEDLDLERHVSDRIEAFKKTDSSPMWFSAFFTAPIKATIDSVFQKISNAVTKEVLGSWRNIFQRKISAKSISVDWNIDTQKGDIPYASFVVSDGESRYSISERSLGFRWFFSFLLFTAFKQAQKRSTIFLFDEPAANLHAKAQAELLTSFSKIVSEGNAIIYSTHSHHMINPQWLSGAYIVENSALDYDSDDAFGLTTKPTSIRITRYRNFVADYPTRSSYFQPVIEKLQYVTPEIVGSSPFAIIEGITDYYALTLTMKHIGEKSFSLIPGSGASASAPLISLLLGRGERFVVLLDDDDEGRKAAKRYREEYFLDNSIAFTLGDVDSRFSGMCLEGLISADGRELIRTTLGCTREPTKKQIGLYLAEQCAVDDVHISLDQCSYENLSRVLHELHNRLSV